MEWAETGSGFAGESRRRQQRWPPTGRRGDDARELNDEYILSSLWEKYESSIDKVERRRLFHVFLKHFLDVYKTWQPVDSGEALETTLFTVFSMEQSVPNGDVVVGSSAGHPAEFLFALVKEVTYLTSFISEINCVMQSTSDTLASTTMTVVLEGQPVLDALTIVVRSVHNCRVFSYHGGVQKLISLIKVIVVQLKTLSGAAFTEESASNSPMEIFGLLDRILIHVVSIILCFMDLNSSAFEVAQMYGNSSSSSPNDDRSIIGCNSFTVLPSEPVLKWKQKAVLSFMEAGGINWLVELMRVRRRFGVEPPSSVMPLQYLTLRVMRSTLAENPRGQNHFRSIGGLEVLLDVLALPSSIDLASLRMRGPDDVTRRYEMLLMGVFQLHVLCLEVLREAVFGNLNNLQYICENGRVHKFANSFCSTAFMLQAYNQQNVQLSFQHDIIVPVSGSEDQNAKSSNSGSADLLAMNSCVIRCWGDYACTLSRSLCSFILYQEEQKASSLDGAPGSNTLLVTTAYRELSLRWFLRVLHVMFSCIKACVDQDEFPTHLWLFTHTLQNHVIFALRKVVDSWSSLVAVFQEEGIWKFVFSDNFFQRIPRNLSEVSCASFGNSVEDRASLCHSNACCSNVQSFEGSSLQMEIISLVLFSATSSGNPNNYPECSALFDALEQSVGDPAIATCIAKSLLQILQLAQEKTVFSFMEIDAASRMLKVACMQAQELNWIMDESTVAESCKMEVSRYETYQSSNVTETSIILEESVKASVELFCTYLSAAADVKTFVLNSSTCIDCLFGLFWVEGLRSLILGCILDVMKAASTVEEDQTAKLQLFSKYLETFTLAKEREKDFTNIYIDLLTGIREMLLRDQLYNQAIFQDAGCFLHVVSLLNGTSEVANGDMLIFAVLHTLTVLLADNEASKDVFRDLVGVGYQTLESLLLEYSKGKPSEQLLNALLDMLVDGDFDIKGSPLIKNEDVIILYLSILRKSSNSLEQNGLSIWHQLLHDSISNRDSCVRAGMLSFLLDWFSEEDNASVILKIAQLIQVIGGYSISGKDIRKIFAVLRSQKVGNKQQYCSLLMSCILSMLNEKGPTAFFDLNGKESGIVIRSPVQWPLNRGFSFSCWVRVESFPESETMSLFSFLTENGKGCLVHLAENKLIYESINQKCYCVSLPVNLVSTRWHFLCVTHSIGRAFSGGSIFKCYIDGALISSEKCRYPRVNESSAYCAIGAKIPPILFKEDKVLYSIKDSSPFVGQIGPIYMFNDAITSDQVLGIYSLGPSYMYSFLDNEVLSGDDPLPGGICDAKDGLSSKISFGLNAQASQGRKLYNVSSLPQNVVDRHPFEANALPGTQLCSRRLLKEIIYCVGGIAVFFPLFTQCHSDEPEDPTNDSHTSVIPVTQERVTAEVIDLIASALDDNISNQQQMHLISGFSILGYLMQSVPRYQLNLESLSAIKHLFNVVANCGLSELLVKEAITHIFLNPLVWVSTVYKVQRDLYMFLIQQFDNDPRLLQNMCRLQCVLNFVHQYYSDNAEIGSSVGNKCVLYSPTDNGQTPGREEIRKLRLLLLSLAEMSMRQSIDAFDIKALVAFLERSDDMICIEDVLHMVIRVISQKPQLAIFVEQVNLIGGCHVFINLLQREYEPTRLLSLQLLGRLLVGLPSEKKGTKIFYLAVGRSRSLSEDNKKASSRTWQIFSAISDRLFKFPLTENLRATLFDVLLGGASPKQVLQKQSQLEQQRSKGNSSHFLLPSALVLICRFLSECRSAGARVKVISDLLELLDSNTSNIEAFMEKGWNAWLEVSMELDAVKRYKLGSSKEDGEMNEQNLVRNLFSVVLCHYMSSVKGGWQYLEETTNFIFLHFERSSVSYHYFLRDIYEDLICRMIDLSSENILFSQPCRDNTLYLLKLVDEFLLSEIDHKLPFPASGSELFQEFLKFENFGDLGSVLTDALQSEPTKSEQATAELPIHNEEMIMDEGWWKLYDYVWILISEMNGKGASKMLANAAPSSGPSLSQRARSFVESLNIPAAEMAAAVVSAGLGSALVGKSSKTTNKAMLLRGEKCPRIVFRLVVLYICRASLERASCCVQQIISLLSSLIISDDEPSKNRLMMFIWSLLALRSHYGMLDDGMRFHVISQLIKETFNCCKSTLVSSIVGRDFPDANSSQKAGLMHNLVQKDRILLAVTDEANYLKDLKNDRAKQLHDFGVRIEENISADCIQKKAFEAEVASSLSSIVSSDNRRREEFQLATDEEQQVVAENWLHVFRSLIDERSPWSTNPFPNGTISHWKLDKTEDSWRRRPKLRQNYHFDESLCHPSRISSEKDLVIRASESKWDSGGPIAGQMKRFLLKGIRRVTDEGSLDSLENDAGPSTLHTRVMSDSLSSELVKDCAVDKEPVQERKDAPSTVSERNCGEVLVSVPCVLITARRKLAGNLAMKKNVLHFSGEFLVEGAAASSLFKNFDSLENSAEPQKHDESTSVSRESYLRLLVNVHLDADRQNAIGRVDKQGPNIKRHRRWNIDKVKAVFWTRYLLRYTALEIFFSNSVAPVFINFSSRKVAKDVGNLIVATRNELFQKGNARDRSGAISLIDRHVAQDMAETAKESWRRREISNFEYLMILNTLAGRTYNDLTQYPVFPWVIADYSSEALDFNKSSTFRDLAKPVGALDSKRFEVFADRYQNFSDPDIPSFHYGSHYSSLGIVLFYLVRLEPFTTLHRNLQGGKFDNADRLFHSIEATYQNCLSNTSDVKELTPEFFYMPEFLVNMNSYHLGIKQDGEPIADVFLPPWAKGSAEEFINKNREALESEYVSSNLHHWIDLIFGYKQRGKPAVEAANIFYYLTYEGAVDLDSIEDELQRSAIADQIANFGQTPIQIFRKKHPRRGPPIPIAHPLRFAPSSICLTSILSNTSGSSSMLLYVGVYDSNVVLVHQGRTISVKMWLTSQLQSGGNFTFSGSQEPFFGIGSDVLSPRKILSPLAENTELGTPCYTTLQTSENFLISSGNWDNSFQVISLSDGIVVQSIRQHKDVVTAVSVTSDGSILATGSRDTTVMVWEVYQGRAHNKRVRSQNELPQRDYVISETPSHVLCGHDDTITCLHASSELDIVISGSKDGTCVFHTLREGRYIRSLCHPSGSAFSKLVVSRHGRIVMYADDDLSLHLFSINGKCIGSSESNGRLNCIELSVCGEFLVCAGDQGQIFLRSMNSLDIVMKYAGVGKTITSLAVTPEECFLAGTKDGSLLVYSIENPLQKPSLSNSSKSKLAASG